MEKQIYLGDGAYARVEDWGDVTLYTSDGLNTTNQVVLEPHLLENFLRWVDRIAKARKAADDGL